MRRSNPPRATRVIVVNSVFIWPPSFHAADLFLPMQVHVSAYGQSLLRFSPAQAILKPLEQFSFSCSEAIASVADIVGAFRRGDGSEGWPDRRPQAGHRARGDGPQARFEFGKDLFDGIKVRAVRGQVKQPRAGRLNSLADPGHFMTGQINLGRPRRLGGAWGRGPVRRTPQRRDHRADRRGRPGRSVGGRGGPQ